MPDFYKQYKFKDTGTYVESFDQFINIRVGAHLIKDTGDEYIKVSDHVYDRVQRVYLTPSDIEGKYALLEGSNFFKYPQYTSAEPEEPYSITNKQYVDALVQSSAVDLSGYARLDAENAWEQLQTCNIMPIFRQHLANKAYVDDRINEIVFDTTALAKLNSANVFTASQSVTVEPTEPQHLTTKKYVDDSTSQLITNISGFVRADFTNTFTAPQNFTKPVTVPEPQADNEAATKAYVDKQIGNFEGEYLDFARLSETNTFQANQIIRGSLTATSVVFDKHKLDEFAIDPDNIQTISGITESSWTVNSPYIGIMNDLNVSGPYAASNAHAPLNKLDDNIVTGEWFNNSPFVADIIRNIKIVHTGGSSANGNISMLKKSVDQNGFFNATTENAESLSKLITGVTSFSVDNPDLSISIRNDLSLTSVISDQTCNTISAKGHNTVVIKNTECHQIEVVNSKCILDGVTCDKIKIVSGELIVSGAVTGNIEAINSMVFLEGAVSGTIECSRGSHAQIYANRQYNLTLKSYASVDDKDFPQNNILGDGTETNIDGRNRKTATYVNSSLGFKIGFTNNDLKLYACRIATLEEGETTSFTDFDGISHTGLTREDFETMQQEACAKYLSLL